MNVISDNSYPYHSRERHNILNFALTITNRMAEYQYYIINIFFI